MSNTLTVQTDDGSFDCYVAYPGIKGPAPVIVVIQEIFGVNCKFNLIPFNPFPESGLLRSKNPRIKAFAQVLIDGGLVTTIRKTRGDVGDVFTEQLDINHGSELPLYRKRQLYQEDARTQRVLHSPPAAPRGEPITVRLFRQRSGVWR